MGAEGYTPVEFDEKRAHETAEEASSIKSENFVGGEDTEHTMSEAEEAELQAFLREVSSAEREQEVDRILSCFKLNPYEHLNLPLDATADDARRAYRKISLMVHPDKCSHPNAQRAFEAVGVAHSLIVHDSSKRNELLSVFERAKNAVMHEWAKEAKSDSAARTRHGNDPDAMWKQFSLSPEFHLRWKAKAREVLTENEWRKRRMHGRMQRDEEQAKLEYQQDKEEVQESKKRKQEWEDSREERVGGWRKFMQSQQRKKQKKRGSSAHVGASGGSATREVRPPGPKPEQKSKQSNKFGLMDGRRIERPDEVTRAF